jgi:hypothetical protein
MSIACASHSLTGTLVLINGAEMEKHTCVSAPFCTMRWNFELLA